MAASLALLTGTAVEPCPRPHTLRGEGEGNDLTPEFRHYVGLSIKRAVQEHEPLRQPADLSTHNA